MYDPFLTLNLVRHGLLSIVKVMDGLSDGPTRHSHRGPTGRGASNPETLFEVLLTFLFWKVKLLSQKWGCPDHVRSPRLDIKILNF